MGLRVCSHCCIACMCVAVLCDHARSIGRRVRKAVSYPRHWNARPQFACAPAGSSLHIVVQTVIVMNPCTNFFFTALANVDRIVTRLCVCRVEDYWHGYKLFCYSFYSHSVVHESEFRRSKLGAANLPKLFDCAVYLLLSMPCCRAGLLRSFPVVLSTLAFPQGGLCCNIAVICLLPPDIPSETPACSFSLWWRCSASGSCRRIVVTSSL